MPRLAGGIRSASIITLLALLGLAGCSTTDTFEQPAPVPEVGVLVPRVQCLLPSPPKRFNVSARIIDLRGT